MNSLRIISNNLIKFYLQIILKYINSLSIEILKKSLFLNSSDQLFELSSFVDKHSREKIL